MADSTLSNLPQANTPISGGDLFYIVQGGTSKNIPASGVLTNPSTGIVISTSGNNKLISVGFTSGQALPLGSISVINTGNAGKQFLAYYETGWNYRFLDSPNYLKDYGMIIPSATTSFSTQGTPNPTTAGTVSTLVASETFGKMTNFSVTNAALFQPGGIQFTESRFYRGSKVGRNGYYMMARFAITGNSVGEWSNPSGSRIYVGMGTNDPNGSNIGVGNGTFLSYIWATGGTNPDKYYSNWMITSCSSSTEFTGACAMNFNTGFYKFGLFCPPYPNNGTIYWQLDDLINNSGCQGSITGQLPIGNNAMMPLISINAVSGVKNVMSSMLYAESGPQF